VPLIASLVLLALAVLPLPASAWNNPGHMLRIIADNSSFMPRNYRKKRWDDVTVQCWIPARLCTKLDLFSQRLNVPREQGLETLLRLLLEEKKRELGTWSEAESMGYVSSVHFFDSSQSILPCAFLGNFLSMRSYSTGCFGSCTLSFATLVAKTHSPSIKRARRN
jgi:hypothetical protein